MQADPQVPAVRVDDLENTGPVHSERNLEDSVVNLIALTTATIVSGFAAYRWYQGDYLGAGVNSVIVVSVVVTLLLGRLPRFRAVGMNLFGVTISAACLMSALLVSTNGLMWALLVLLINALILTRIWALGLNAAVILILTASTELYDTMLQQASWTTVALLITAFTMMLTDQLRDQRKALARQANLDPLTGTANRRLMVAHLSEIVAERRRDQRSATLMVLDLDLFKQVNDRYGHETGDRVLIEFSHSVASCLRETDGLYRMGGEEFVVLLRGMDLATARAELPELHQRLSGMVSAPGGPIEFSAGAAVLHEDEDWSEWLGRADRALYKAKESGRNRLEFSES